MSTSKMSHRTAVAVGLIVLLAVAIVWTVVDGAGADSTTIGAVLAHQDTAWVSVGVIAVIAPATAGWVQSLSWFPGTRWMRLQAICLRSP